MALPTGSRLGPYEIIAPLGAGGMGEVYRARDPRLGREVAVKVLPPALVAEPDRLRRFEHEARAASALSHPGITVVYDVGNHQGVPFLVTELLVGVTLRERLSAGPLPVRKATELAAQAARALDAAHAKGIVHRDLKPENLFLTADGRLKLLDFGLARSLGGEHVASTLEHGPTIALGTSPGVVLGTAGYMAPEQVRGEAAGPAADVFALGCVLFEMLAGRRAFTGDGAIATLHAILERDPLTDRHGLEGVSAALLAILERCLEKAPGERFHSAHDLALALEAVAAAGSGEGGPGTVMDEAGLAARRSTATGAHPRTSTARRIAIAAAGVVAALVMALAGAWVGRRLWSPPPPTFTLLTFERGFVQAARFAPDGRSVVYAASWSGRPAQIYVKRPEGPSSVPVGPPGAELLAVSPDGVLAVRLERRLTGPFTVAGTLARMPIAGGAPRLLDRDIVVADWSPASGELALVRELGDRQRLEMPPGTILHETPGRLSHLRVSPDGRELAFLEHPLRENELGYPLRLVLADRRLRWPAGRHRAVVCAGTAWSADGDELFFGSANDVLAVDATGRARTVLRLPQALTLHDRAADGRLLVAQESRRVSLAARDATGERDLTWINWSLVMDLTADGATLLLTEWGGGGDRGVAALRGYDGSPVVELGEGFATGISADGQWVAAALHDPAQVLLLPTGAGTPRRLPATGIRRVSHPRFLPDGRHVVFTGVGADAAVRLNFQSVNGGEPRAFGPPGVGFGTLAVSPDGTRLVTSGPDDRPWLYTVGGDEAQPLPFGEPGEEAIRWTPDGSAIYLRRTGEVPARLRRVALADGRSEEIGRLAPADAAGVLWVSPVVLSADAERFAFSYFRVLSELYEVRGSG